jgi:GNAT superfamily N-acetyltransferase
MRNPEIVALEASQIHLASEILGHAFQDDPLFQSFTDLNDHRRLSSLRSIGKMALHYAYPHRAVFTTIDVMKGVAIWIPPHQFPLDIFRLLKSGAYALPFQLNFIELLQLIPLFLRVEVCHEAWMSRPHWYLLMLGVHPHYQNQGIGSTLMVPVLAEADRENMPCYLETSTAAAVRFYQKQGFEVVETISFAKKDIQIWAMKREPQFKSMSIKDTDAC